MIVVRTPRHCHVIAEDNRLRVPLKSNLVLILGIFPSAEHRPLVIKCPVVANHSSPKTSERNIMFTARPRPRVTSAVTMRDLVFSGFLFS